MAVAHRLHLPGLATSAQSAYLDAMSVVLLVCGAIALVGAILTAIALPSRPAQSAPESEHELSRVA
jgi:hypothetical protein